MMHPNGAILISLPEWVQWTCLAMQAVAVGFVLWKLPKWIRDGHHKDKE